MNNFKFYVLGNFSPNIRTFGKCKSTCYMLMGFKRIMFLDFGAGIFHDFKRIIEEKKIDFSQIIIIISHNHIDHNFSLLELSSYLEKYNRKNGTKVKVKVVMPKRSIIYSLANKSRVLDVYILNEEFKMNIGGAKFSFCKTIHKGESYATKIEYKNKIFVYTSDIARYSNKLKDFIKNSDTVLVDAGYPNKKIDNFRNYHGRTKDILNETAKQNVKKIYATHLRFFSKYEDYKKCFPINQNIELVLENNEYDLFK